MPRETRPGFTGRLQGDAEGVGAPDLSKLSKWIGEEAPAPGARLDRILGRLSVDAKAELLWVEYKHAVMSLYYGLKRGTLERVKQTKAGDVAHVKDGARVEGEALKKERIEAEKKFLETLLTSTHENVFPWRKKVVSDNPELADRLVTIRALWEDQEVRVLFEEEWMRHMKEAEDVKAQRVSHQEIKSSLRKTQHELDVVTQEMFAQRGSEPSMMDALIYQDLRHEVEAQELKSANLEKTDTAFAAQAEYDRLREMKRQWTENGFMWLPSRIEAERDLAEALLLNRPVLMLAESGTGKTTLVNATARKLTGRNAFETKGSATSDAEARFARPKANIQETFYEYTPLTQAFTGKEASNEAPEEHFVGGIGLLDEGNMDDIATTMTVVKEVAKGLSTGRLHIPGTGVEERVLPKAGFVMSGNPPGERYARRQPFDNAVLREFGKVMALDYPEQTVENPEIFRACKAVLLNEGDRLHVDPKEIAPAFTLNASKGKKEVDKSPAAGGFLWRFANGYRAFLDSYAHRDHPLLKSKVATGGVKEEYYLDKMLIDMGIVLGWMEQYKRTRVEQSLEFFVTHKLKDIIENPVYSEEDRKLAKEIFRFFGIDIENPAHPSVQLQVLTPQDIGMMDPKVPQYEKARRAPVPKGVIAMNETGDEVMYFPVPLLSEFLRSRDGKIWKLIGNTMKSSGGDPVFQEVIVSSSYAGTLSPSDLEGAELGSVRTMSKEIAVKELGRVVLAKPKENPVSWKEVKNVKAVFRRNCGSRVTSADFTADGRHLVTVTEAGTVQVHTDQGELIMNDGEQGSKLVKVDCGKQGDRCLILRHMRNQEQKKVDAIIVKTLPHEGSKTEETVRLEQKSGSIKDAFLSFDESCILVQTVNNSLALFNIETKAVSLKKNVPEGIYQAAPSPVADMFLTVFGDQRTVVFYDYNGQELGRYTTERNDLIRRASFSANGSRVLLELAHGKSWNVIDISGSKIKTPPCVGHHEENLNDDERKAAQQFFQFISPDGSIVVMKDKYSHGYVQIWDAEKDNKKLGELDCGGELHGIKMNSDGSILVIDNHDQVFLSNNSGTTFQTLNFLNSGKTHSVASMSPNNKYILTTDGEDVVISKLTGTKK